jgi:RecJ-like exonuclease
MTCPTCHGTGKIDEPGDCPQCRGYGNVPEPSPVREFPDVVQDLLNELAAKVAAAGRVAVGPPRLVEHPETNDMMFVVDTVPVELANAWTYDNIEVIS